MEKSSKSESEMVANNMIEGSNPEGPSVVNQDELPSSSSCQNSPVLFIGPLANPNLAVETRYVPRDVKEDTPGVKGTLTGALYQLLVKMWSGRYSLVQPRHFKELLGLYHPQFQDYRQVPTVVSLVAEKGYEFISESSQPSWIRRWQREYQSLFVESWVLNEKPRLQRLADGLVDRVVTLDLIQRQYERVKLHMTVLNTLFRKDTSGTSAPRVQSMAGPLRDREAFSAVGILQKFEDFEFGPLLVDRVELSQRYSTGADGFYQSSGSLKLV